MKKFKKQVGGHFQSLLLLFFVGTFLGSCNPSSISEKDMSAYLMVYFKDATHSLYMALSPDG